MMLFENPRERKIADSMIPVGDEEQKGQPEATVAI
jgi:hypothetical protein